MPVASVPKSQSSTNHPVLGPGVAIRDDSHRTRLRLVFEVAMIPVGILGILLGTGDFESGSQMFGLAQIAAGVLVIVWAIRAVVLDAQHLANPVRLVVARDGFELFPGTRRTAWLEVLPSRRAVSWDDVATVGDSRFPTSPRTLRVQLDDPAGFADRESLGPVDRLILRANRCDLVLGSGMAMSISNAEDIMRKQLTEFRRGGPAAASIPTRSRASSGRRPARKRKTPGRPAAGG